jgi:hypothetical protein
MTHDCCWARSGTSSSCHANALLATLPRGVATLWHALVHWQVRRLKRRIAAYEPDRRWLA